MQLADRLTLDAPRRTADGYMAVRAKAARVGVYDYLASEVGAPDSFKPTDTVKVYRDEAEVFAADSVRSFVGKPITNDHPREGVNVNNWRDHARGTVMGAMRDGEYLAFDLTLMDAAAIRAVEGGKRELSNGYECQLDWTPGTAPDGSTYDARQTGIRGNHVALVDSGRAGPHCAIKDGERFALCDANPQALHDGKDGKMPHTLTIDGLHVPNVSDEAKAAIEKLQGQISTLSTDKATAETQVATLTTDKATLDAKVVTLTQQLADAVLTPAKLQDAAKAYAVVVGKAKALGVAVTDAMDEPAIRKAVVTAKVGDAAKDWTPEQVAASFATLTADVKPGAEVVNIGSPKPFADSAAVVSTLRLARYN